MTEIDTPTKETELFVFDLDGTLAPSKQPVETDMVETLGKLIAKRKVAVIGGGSFTLFSKQFKAMMEAEGANLSNLSLFPTSGAQYYKFENGWQKVYAYLLSEEEKAKIISCLKQAVTESGVEIPTQTYGEVIEDRETQVSWSPFGQEAPLDVKKDWDLDIAKRQKIKKVLDTLIPEFEVRIGGTTTIDVTKKGIDKAYGIRMMQQHLGVQIENMFFIGDALFPGGNDYSVVVTGIKTRQVRNEKECRMVIESILPILD